MRMKWFPIKCLVIIMLVMQIVPIYEGNNRVHAFSNQVIQHGAVGEDVIELQSRLQFLGFYTGKIDGVFGWRTYWALRNFQYEFGLPIDGLAGAETKAKLVKASKYNKQFVNNQIQKGNKFTHYGGVDLNKQKAPAPNNQPATSASTDKQPAPANQPQHQKAAGTSTKKSTSRNAVTA